jgi:hypothetical protein
MFVNCAAPDALPSFMANSQYILAPSFATSCPATGASLLATSFNLVAFPLAQPLACPPTSNQSPFVYANHSTSFPMQLSMI